MSLWHQRHRAGLTADIVDQEHPTTATRLGARGIDGVAAFRFQPAPSTIVAELMTRIPAALRLAITSSPGRPKRKLATLGLSASLVPQRAALNGAAPDGPSPPRREARVRGNKRQSLAPACAPDGIGHRRLLDKEIDIDWPARALLRNLQFAA